MEQTIRQSDPADEQEAEGGAEELTTQAILLAAANGGNVADLLSDDKLKELGHTVAEGYRRDRDTRTDWDEQMAEAKKLAMQIREQKSFPWEGAANIKAPMLTTACVQFHARAMPQLVRTPEPVKGKISGIPTQEKLTKAYRIGKHMSWQLVEQMETWEEDMDVLLLVLPLVGSCFKKTYRDRTKNINASDLVFADDLVFGYYERDVERARRKTHTFNLCAQDIEERVRLGVYRKTDLGTAKTPEDTPAAEVAKEVRGQEPSGHKDDTPYRILEQHTWADLDGDGYEEPYILTVEEGTEEVLRIDPRFDVKDVKWRAGKVAKITAVEAFTQYRFLPDPTGGVMGLGWGHLLAPINETVNTVTNQLLDAGTDQNTGGGIFNSALLPGAEAKTLRFKPGEYKGIKMPGVQDVRQVFMDRPKSQPSQVLLQLLQLMIGWGERLSSTTDIMTGEMPAANTTATTTLATVEQGGKVFTGIFKRQYRSFNRELRKLYNLNKKYLTESEYFAVLDSAGTPPAAMPETQFPGWMGVGPADYQGDGTDVQPTADPTAASEVQLMARIRAAQEGRSQGINFNPEIISKWYADAMGLGQEEAKKLLAPGNANPAAEAEKIKAEAEAQKTQAEIALKQKDLQIKEFELQVRQIEAQVRLAQLEQQGQTPEAPSVPPEHEMAMKHAEMAHKMEMDKMRADLDALRFRMEAERMVRQEDRADVVAEHDMAERTQERMESRMAKEREEMEDEGRD